MRRLFVALTSSVSVLAFAHMASAADILRKAPPPALLPPPIQDWSGVYVGVEGGYGWGHQSLSSNVTFLLTPNDTICQSLDGDFFKHDCNSFREFNDFQRDFGGFTTGSGDASNPIIPFSGHNQSGGVIGGFFGVQKQWGSWVLGFEGSVDYANIKGSGTGSSQEHDFSTGDVNVPCGSENCGVGVLVVLMMTALNPELSAHLVWA